MSSPAAACLIACVALSVSAVPVPFPRVTPADPAFAAAAAAAAQAAPGPPTITSVMVVGSTLVATWTSGSGATPTSYRLDFFLGTVSVATVTVGAVTSVALPIPPETQGAFTLQVTALTGVVASPASLPFPFVIGTVGCTGPPATPTVTGTLVAGSANVTWTALGAASYIVSAGTTLGGTNLMAPTNVGATTVVSASGLPAGFTAWVRVTAVNACGQSAPRDYFLAAITSFVTFTTRANACVCWIGQITLEANGVVLGSMTCIESRTFPVSPGTHSFRACDPLGCVTSTHTVPAGTTQVLELFCT